MFLGFKKNRLYLYFCDGTLNPCRDMFVYFVVMMMVVSLLHKQPHVRPVRMGLTAMTTSAFRYPWMYAPYIFHIQPLLRGKYLEKWSINNNNHHLHSPLLEPAMLHIIYAYVCFRRPWVICNYVADLPPIVGSSWTNAELLSIKYRETNDIGVKKHIKQKHFVSRQKK